MKYVPYYLLVLVIALFLATVASSGTVAPPTEPCRLPAGACRIPCVTINNWLDPSGGRLRGLPNYQTMVWQDYLNPYPPHGMKGFLAERVLRDVGALEPAREGAPAGLGGLGGGAVAERESERGGRRAGRG